MRGEGLGFRVQGSGFRVQGLLLANGLPTATTSSNLQGANSQVEVGRVYRGQPPTISDSMTAKSWVLLIEEFRFM